MRFHRQALFALVAFAICPASAERIVLHGDSIVKGYGFGNYTDPSPLRTLHGIFRILLEANVPHAPEVPVLTYLWKVSAEGKVPVGPVDSVAKEIAAQVQRGEIRKGDWLIYEDAGGIDDSVHPAPWPDATRMYERYRASLRGMIREASKTVGRERIVLMTMFDYEPSAKCKWCRWDAPLDDGVHTGNDAIREEAKAGRVRLVDMNRIMDAANQHVQDLGFGRMVGPDGIHPNVYGNFVMVLALAREIGYDIARWDLSPLAKRFLRPASGGDVERVWGFTKDPSDAERRELLEALRKLIPTRQKR